MTRRDLDISSVWAGTAELSALSLNIDPVAEIVILFWLTAVGLIFTCLASYPCRGV